MVSTANVVVMTVAQSLGYAGATTVIWANMCLTSAREPTSSSNRSQGRTDHSWVIAMVLTDRFDYSSVTNDHYKLQSCSRDGESVVVGISPGRVYACCVRILLSSPTLADKKTWCETCCNLFKQEMRLLKFIQFLKITCHIVKYTWRLQLKILWLIFLLI